MPEQIWKHTCKNGSVHYSFYPSDCKCGQPDEYVGYHYDRMEKMAWFQKLYGLKPAGPHRQMADRIFSEVTRSCDGCDGAGLLNNPMWIGWLLCPCCGGSGKLWTVSAEDRQVLRMQVLESFPEAEASDEIANPVYGQVVQDMKTGCMIVLTKADFP